MAKKSAPRRKASFGTAYSNHISPPPSEDAPIATTIVISFEESLKLHLALGQALAHLNGYDRREAKATGVKMTIYPRSNYITVQEGKLRKQASATP